MAKRERRGGLQGDKGHWGYKHGLRGGKGKLWDRDKHPPPRPYDEDEVGNGEDPYIVEDFKKGGSVKVRGSGIATQGVRPAKMVKMKGS